MKTDNRGRGCGRPWGWRATSRATSTVHGRKIRAGIAELEDGPPSAGRARLYRALGWTYVFGGPLDEGIPFLELARSEAEACGDAETLRWAMQDLGIGLAHQGRLGKDLSLLEESFRLARAAGDRPLIQRSVGNLLDSHLTRGDRLDAIVTIAEEELETQRRANVVNSATVLAGNLGDCMAELGRLDEAIAYADEAVATASAVTPTVLRNVLITRSFVHRLRGEAAAAARDDAEASRIAADPEPQMGGWHLLWQAWMTWWDEPRATTNRLVAALRQSDVPAPYRSEAAHEAARMAFRVADDERLGEAVAVMRGCGQEGGPGLRARHEWIEALLTHGPEGRIRDAAVRLEELGWRRHALDAWADAALLAARAGRSSDAEERAHALARSTGLHPLLGPLPETRWVDR